MRWVDRPFRRLDSDRFGYDGPPNPNDVDDSDGAEQLVQSRYRLMLRSAPPETIERAHAVALARLSSAQRVQILKDLVDVCPEEHGLRVDAAQAQDSQALAILATRVELRTPGFLEGRLNGRNGSTLFSSFVAGFVGSAAAQAFLGSRGALDPNHHDAASVSEPDFSSEFGQGANASGFAGGSGFEKDDFDPVP